MAKKTGKDKQSEKKTKKGKKQTYIFIMAMVVIITMVVSGLYYLGSQDEEANPTPKEKEPAFNSYNLNSIPLNASITVKADQPLMELVALPKAQCISAQAIGWVYNVSMPGMRSVLLDAVDYGRDSAGNICGNFLLFKFSFDYINETTITELNNQLANRLGDYNLKRSYTGILPVNLSGPGTDKVYVIGSTDIAKGDTAEILLFQKTSDGSLFALERNKIAEGPTVPATVLELTDIIASGTVAGEYALDKIEQKINVTSSRLTPAKFSVNGTLDNKTVNALSALIGVSVEQADNVTKISYNASMNGVKDILDAGNISYSLEKGNAMLQIPLNVSLTNIQQVLKAGGITEPKINKAGLAKVPALVRINGKTATIEDSDKFSVVLNTDAKVGDRINITLSALQFGDQVFIVGGTQT
jgi:hypothetical protein